LSTSDIRAERGLFLGILRRWLIAAAVCVGVDRIYAIFSHNVASAAMDNMFLYPLALGAGVFALAYGLFPWVYRSPHFQDYRNLHSAGVAVLTTGSMLRGILEIAGTGSNYLTWFTAAGLVLLAAGLAVFLAMAFSRSGCEQL